MRLHIEHETRYNYATPADYALLQLRITPRSSAAQTVLDWDLALDGGRHQAQFIDQFGAQVDLVELMPGAQSLGITVAGQIETRGSAPLQPKSDPSPSSKSTPQTLPNWFFLRPTALTQFNADMNEIIKAARDEETGSIAQLHALSRHILARVKYQSGTTHTHTSAADALALGTGVCQDHTHLFLACARQMDLPSRYVSGYLMMNDRTDQEATHAWAESYIKNLGWVGFDVSNGISPDERYVKIAHGQDYTDCTPTRGIVIGARQDNLVVSIQVQQ